MSARQDWHRAQRGLAQERPPVIDVHRAMEAASLIGRAALWVAIWLAGVWFYLT